MVEKRTIPHLLDEPPISVYPSLAVALGNVNKAIILQQLHYLLQSAKVSKNEYVHIDGKWWVYNSYKEWHKYFPWLAEVTIKGLFGMLEHDGIVVSQQGVKDKLDRRKWYTIDYDAYLAYISSIGQNLSDEHEIKNIPSEGQNLSDVNKESEISNSEKKNISRKREPDPIFDAIAKVWKTSAGGYIGQMKAMMLGNAKKGEWAKCNFDTPATAEEILAFETYAHTRMAEKNITEVPTACVTIQRWFYDMRQAKIIELNKPEQPAAAPFDISQWAVRESIYAKDNSS